MTKIILIAVTFLLTSVLSAQHLRKGYDISYNMVYEGLLRRDLDFPKVPWDTTTYFTGGTDACSGGLKHLTKVQSGGNCQTIAFLDNGHTLDIDYEKYPYMAVRIRTTCNKDIQLNIKILDGGQNKTFTVKGGGIWNTIRLDFCDNKTITSLADFMLWTWMESAGTTFPYEIFIDYIKLGDIADPDSTVSMSMDTVADQVCEKDGGQQSVLLTGISNGKDTVGITLSQVNSRSVMFESITFDPLQANGSCVMNYIPKTGNIGVSDFQVIAKYSKGDSVFKYSSSFFTISVITDPKLTVVSNVNIQKNQPVANIKLSNITNGTGGQVK